MQSRRVVILGALALVVFGVPSLYMRLSASRFPPDTTPEGAYARIVLAVSDDKLENAFAYLETRSQWAVFSIWDYEKKSYDLVDKAYPKGERESLLAAYDDAHRAKDGPELFARMAASRGFVARLRRDLSGIEHVEIQGERATVQTVHGTRYAFRKRENGIWGLTLFTAELVASAERAARDFSVVEAAARDYGTK